MDPTNHVIRGFCCIFLCFFKTFGRTRVKTDSIENKCFVYTFSWTRVKTDSIENKFLLSQVLHYDTDGGWKMVTIDENKPRGLAPPFFQRILKTAWFHISILLLVLANAITTATINFDHYKINPYEKIDGYYYAEVSKENCVLTHWGQDKMAVILQTIFQMHFHEWKVLYFDWTFTEPYSSGSHWQ